MTILKINHTSRTAIALAIVAVCCSARPQNQTTSISIDANAPAHAFPHFWEQMFGSGRAVLSLRDNYREDRKLPSRHSETIEKGDHDMTPVVAAKKLSKFNPATFLSTMDGGRKISAFPKTANRES